MKRFGLRSERTRYRSVLNLLLFCGLHCFSALGFTENRSFFGESENHLIYFHSHTATDKELSEAAIRCPLFEIDLAWAYSAFHPQIVPEKPYIGHPEEFYTKLGRPFPTKNVSLQEFQEFLKDHPSVKVLLDIKDENVFPYLEEFVKVIGAERCLVHTFIKNWTVIPVGIDVEPHWHREDVDLFVLDELLSRLGLYCIANCRGFSDAHIQEEQILFKMFNDAKKCKSIRCLGLYYPGAPLPSIEFLEEIHRQGYYVWVNGNVSEFQEKIGKVRYIAMSDDMEQCTSFYSVE